MKAMHFPMIKISVFFILGIFVGFYIKLNVIYGFSALIMLLSIFTSVFFKSNKNKIQNNFFGILAFILAFSVGLLNQTIHNNLYDKSHYINQLQNVKEQHLLEVSLKEKLKNSSANDRFVANVIRFDNKKSSGKIILNIKKDSSTNGGVIIGNRLKLRAIIYKNKKIKNPNQFDYGQYLENQNIYAQVYCAVNDISISPLTDKNVWYYTAKFRNQIIKNLEKNDFSKNELAVITALILGQQQDISPEILQDYQLAGAVHILSVSGLHVGFIMLFIGYLLKPFPNTKKWKIYKLTIIILSLWLFGFVAGLAPSVLRSVVMFSFVAVGRYLGRGVNIYNTLMVSAFFILLYQPSFLFDVGFQLSYISLFFIVWLEPLFADIWQPKNKIIKFCWNIITVSIAAQIGAVGLSIYYFHQFPGLFFLTNLVILPTMGFILAYGVIIMIFAYFDIAPHFATEILEKSIWLLNQVIGWIASLEQFILRDISLNKVMLVSIYLMIIITAIYFKKPSYNKLLLTLFSIIILQTSFFVSKYYYQKQKELVVFNIKKNSIITERIGSKTTIYANDSILKLNNINSNVKQYLIANFTQITAKKSMPSLLFFNNKKILVIDGISIKPTLLQPDILIISHSPKLNLDRFLEKCRPKIIIADGSNFKSYVKVWQATCKKLNIDFYSTADRGFYRL